MKHGRDEDERAEEGDDCLEEPTPHRSGADLAFSLGTVVVTAVLLGAGVVFALLLCGAYQAREAAIRSQVHGKLMFMVLTLHGYHDEDGALPAWAVESQGQPLLSWRVTILPYLEQADLHGRFNLAEAWDGPTNQPHSATPVRTYAWPRDTTPQTYLLGIEGPGAAFERGTRLRLKQDFRDGSSNTVVLAESEDAVPWAKPEDHAFLPNGPLPRFGRMGRSPFAVAIMDGSVRSIHSSVSPETLRAALTRAGNEVLGTDW